MVTFYHLMDNVPTSRGRFWKHRRKQHNHGC